MQGRSSPARAGEVPSSEGTAGEFGEGVGAALARPTVEPAYTASLVRGRRAQSVERRDDECTVHGREPAVKPDRVPTGRHMQRAPLVRALFPRASALVPGYEARVRANPVGGRRFCPSAGLGKRGFEGGRLGCGKVAQSPHDGLGLRHGEASTAQRRRGRPTRPVRAVVQRSGKTQLPGRDPGRQTDLARDPG